MDKLTVKENWDTYRYQIMDGSIPVGETPNKQMAYMFAACPDMYEALKAVEGYLELAGVGQGIYNLVCEALARAEGKEE